MSKDIKKFKEMKEADLKKKLEEFRNDLRGIRFKSEGARSKNVRESRNLRRNIARVLTILNIK